MALWVRFGLVYTPKHGSWLNVTDVGVNVMNRQCLNRRIDSVDDLAREDGGRPGGFRTILLLRYDDLSFLVCRIANSSRENLRRDEFKAFRAMAAEMFRLDGAGIKALLRSGKISEVICDG